MADSPDTVEATQETTTIEVSNIEVETPADNADIDIEVVAESTEPKVHMNGDVKQNTVSYPHVDGIACTLSPASEFVATDRESAVKIRYSGDKGSITGRPAISVMELFQSRVNKFPNRTALEVERDSKWIRWTYKEYLEDVLTVAKAFVKLGLEPYHGVGILGFNAPEWLFSSVAAIYAGGLSSGIYTTNTPEACQYVCADAKCDIVVVENDFQLQKILQVKDSIPTLKAIIQYTGTLKEKLPNVYDWNELIEIGKAENDEALQKRINAQSPNKCCSLIYTSGTTGNPKGVMISHDNLVTAALGAIASISHLVDPDSETSQEVMLSYLPLSHIAAQMQDIWLPIAVSARVAFARPDALKGSLVQSLQAIRPTIFVGVPRVYEKIEEKLKAAGAAAGALKKKLGAWAKGVSLRGNQNKESGKAVPYGWTLSTTILKKVRKALGLDRAKYLITAAAPISRQTLEYFQSLNMPLMEVYGTSESTGVVTLNIPGASHITSIGKIIDINEFYIGNPDDDGSGELMYRGRNIFMGYLNSEEKTKESIDEDGWLHTGDVGKEEDGFFYITGRIKELIVTAGGENIAPVPIEDNIKLELPLVSCAMVIGDKKKFLSCFLTCQVVVDLNTGLPTDDLLPSAVQYCSEIGLNVTKASEIAPDVPELLKKAIQDGMDRANKKAVSNAARVQKWHLLPLDFTTEGGELGPTQKLRRPHVMKMQSYKDIIDGFYAC